jgi:hypothetical protein
LIDGDEVDRRQGEQVSERQTERRIHMSVHLEPKGVGIHLTRKEYRTSAIERRIDRWA